MWVEFWNDVLAPAMLTVLGALVTTLTAMGVSVVRGWAQKQKAEWVSMVMDAVSVAAHNAVLKTNQTFIDEARTAAAGGKLDRESAVAALVHARNVLRAQLGEELWAAFVRIMGGEEAAIFTAESLIEAQVQAVKLEGKRAAVTVD